MDAVVKIRKIIVTMSFKQQNRDQYHVSIEQEYKLVGEMCPDDWLSW